MATRKSRDRSIVLAIVALAAFGLSACGPGTAGEVRPPVVVTLALQHDRVAAGSAISGVATFTNTTARSITVETCAANGWVDVGLSSPAIHYQAIDGGVACRPSVHLAPGPNRFKVTVSTTYQACTTHNNPVSNEEGEPPCGPVGMPALPVGHYATSVVMTGLPSGTSGPKPIAVTLLPPVGAAWSSEVFAAAAVPPGARATSEAVPTLRAPGQSLSDRQIDVHRLYLVPGTRASVATYIQLHLPPGGSANQGDTIQTDPVSYDAEFIPVTMPASGPNEDAATLLYAFAGDGPGVQELRIDAETVSVPDRPAPSEAAPSGRVVVMGYGESSLSGGTSHPISVTLTGERARQMRSAFDRLGLAQPPDCMEYLASFKIQFFTKGSSSPALTASGDFCAGDQVAVETGARTGVSLSDPHCLLLGEVVSSLPARAGSATRGVLRECRMLYVG